MRCGELTLLGAYSLGALDEDERDRVDAHVAGCDACREELDSLVAVRAHLARVAESDVAQPAPAAAPDALRARVLGAARAQRRRAVRRRVAAVAALAAATGLALVARPDGEVSPPALAARAAHDGVRASVAAVARPWGTELTLRLSGVAPGERCRLVVRARDGRRVVAATWWASYRGTAEVTGAAALPLAELIGFDVVTTSGRRLVRVPIDEGGTT